MPTAGPSYTSKAPAAAGVGLQHPGAGSLFVYNQDASDEDAWDGESIMSITRKVSSLDELLERGIGDYTFVNGGVLGTGKFSAVYEVRDKHGRTAAMKHTPLYPHHPLIASRLLREPTLLAQIPPYPNLIGVQGWLRTLDGFYLIEDLPAGYVPLPALTANGEQLERGMAKRILDQLVSVVRDGLHDGGRVCHRDLKGENCLVHPITGDIVLLDLGLATHYSASKPKLTTCCGSPAFHSPEIVEALSQPPGAVTYYGPELDIWCIALTLLALLLSIRFPIGPIHTSVVTMRDRVREALMELDRLYPREVILGRERDEWEKVRAALRDFLEIDSKKRMSAFKKYDVGSEVKAKVKLGKKIIAERNFKSTTFIPTEVKYTLPLFLVEPLELDPCERTITFRNPTDEDDKRVMSYIKYLLRSAGILYHAIPKTDTLQIVLPLSTALSATNSPSGTGTPVAADAAAKTGPPPSLLASLLSPLLSTGRRPAIFRSSSVPAAPKPVASPSPAVTNNRKSKEWAIQAWLRVETHRACCTRRKTSPETSGTDSPTRQPPSPGMPVTPILGMAEIECRAAVMQSRLDMAAATREGSKDAQSTVVITLSDPRVYHVIRDALAVYVTPGKAFQTSRPATSERGRRRSREIEPEITIHSADKSPVIVPDNSPDKGKRSESAETVIVVSEGDDEKPGRTKRNSPQRGRKQSKKAGGGLLEELFGGRFVNHWGRPGFTRASSTPPGGVVIQD